MKTVGVYEAKTHLTQLLVEVEEGQTITITRHGRAIAEIIPARERRQSVIEAIDTLKEFGRTHPRGDFNIREAIEEGRSE